MAVHDSLGLKVFARAFRGLEGSYALIGGMACTVLMRQAELDFRATKDFDTVLLADGDLQAVSTAVWRLVEDGGYSIRRSSDGAPIFYRFDKPQHAGYPKMIELFSKVPDFLKEHERAIKAPVFAGDEVSSLSAILLDEDYYEFLLSGIIPVHLDDSTDRVSVLEADRLIAFKAKAFLDLSERQRAGETVDKRNIRKHKNDVFRLAQLVVPGTRLLAPSSIAADVGSFLEAMRDEEIDLKALLGIRISAEEVLASIADMYGL